MAREVQHTDGFTVHGWMVTEFGLSGGLLTTYAIVHTFSQSEAGVYFGGPGYIASWLGCGMNSARNYLHQLADKGLIVAEDQKVNGVLFRNYRVVDPSKIWSTPPKIGVPLQNLEVDNNNTPNGVYIYNPPTPKKNFDFRAAMLAAGVTTEVADAFLKVRKNKRATNTEIAWKKISAEIQKSGKTADECIRTAVEHSWSGFEAEWLEERQRPSSAPRPRKGGSGDLSAMLEMGRRRFGNMNFNPVCDEQ